MPCSIPTTSLAINTSLYRLILWFYPSCGIFGPRECTLLFSSSCTSCGFRFVPFQRFLSMHKLTQANIMTSVLSIYYLFFHLMHLLPLFSCGPSCRPSTRSTVVDDMNDAIAFSGDIIHLESLHQALYPLSWYLLYSSLWPPTSFFDSCLLAPLADTVVEDGEHIIYDRCRASVDVSSICESTTHTSLQQYVPLFLVKRSSPSTSLL